MGLSRSVHIIVFLITGQTAKMNSLVLDFQDSIEQQAYGYKMWRILNLEKLIFAHKIKIAKYKLELIELERLYSFVWGPGVGKPLGIFNQEGLDEKV